MRIFCTLFIFFTWWSFTIDFFRMFCSKHSVTFKNVYLISCWFHCVDVFYNKFRFCESFTVIKSLKFENLNNLETLYKFRTIKGQMKALKTTDYSEFSEGNTCVAKLLYEEQESYFRILHCMTSSHGTHETSTFYWITLEINMDWQWNLSSLCNIIKERILSKNYTKNVAWKLVLGPFLLIRN